MTDFTMRVSARRPFDETLRATREALTEAGFGVLTEIDVRATLETKLGVEVPSQVILGACRPELARRALAIEPSTATVLPCNVVVRDAQDGTTVIEAFDPVAMISLVAGVSTGADLAAVAADARQRLGAALAVVAAAAEPIRPTRLAVSPGRGYAAGNGGR